MATASTIRQHARACCFLNQAALFESEIYWLGAGTVPSVKRRDPPKVLRSDNSDSEPTWPCGHGHGGASLQLTGFPRSAGPGPGVRVMNVRCRSTWASWGPIMSMATERASAEGPCSSSSNLNAASWVA